MKKSLIIVTLLLLNYSFTRAQLHVQGVVYENLNGKKVPLAFANIFIPGTTRGITSDFNGNYKLEITPLDKKYRVSYVGYKPSEIIIDFNNLTKDIVLESDGGVKLEQVVVKAKAKRSSENLLLLEQKNAIVDRQTIGAQSLATQGISDAANAVTKVTGVTKSESNQTINVRGLGDRYNSTSLNGLPLPSNHAEYKNIDLSLFSTDLVEYIAVEKVFSSKLYPDASGANIDIASKKLSGRDFFKIGISSGTNMNLSNAGDFYLQEGFGISGFEDKSKPTGSYKLKSYNFENSWNLEKQTTKPNIGVAISGGYENEINEEYNLSALASLSYDSKYSYRDLTRKSVNANDILDQDFNGYRNSFKTQTTGILNLSLNGDNLNLSYNSILLNSSDQSLQQFDVAKYKDIADDDETTALVRRSEYERNTVLINQLLFNYKFTERLSLVVNSAFNKLDNILPDRKHNILITTDKKNYYPATNDHSNNHRYFHELNEKEFASNFVLKYNLGKEKDLKYSSSVRLGYSYRNKKREFNSQVYYHKIINEKEIDLLKPSNYFNQSNFGTDYRVQSRTSDYSAKLRTHSVFTALDYKLGEKLVTSIGVRLEMMEQSIDYNVTLGSGSNIFDELNLFPSISAKYELNTKNNLRISYSSTYTLPQFKETAPFLSEGVGESTEGNPDLKPSFTHNTDFKWGFYPKRGELITLTLFGKYIKDPINKLTKNSASNDMTYANTGDWAYVGGVEIEFKKSLWSNEKHKFDFSSNFTLMHTEQELNAEKVKNNNNFSVGFNEDREELQGAAPFIVNASLLHTYKFSQTAKINTSLVYDYVSDKLYSIGHSSRGNQVDKAVSNLNFIVKSKINNWGFSLSVKNLLNPAYERVQQNKSKDIVVSDYKLGLGFSIGVAYKF